MYQKDDILFLDHFDYDWHDGDEKALLMVEVRQAKYVVSAFGTLLKGVDAKYGLIGSTFDRRLLKDPTPKMVCQDSRTILRYDLTLIVEEPDAEPGVDIFSLALLADILEEAGYTSRLANEPTDRGNTVTMVLKKKEPK